MATSNKIKKNKNNNPEAPKGDILVVSKAIRAILANKRQVPAKTLTRGEVRGGGRKPWKQKGTGRARAGSRRSPIWRGGGITFGPNSEKNFSLSINKKELNLAKKIALETKKPNIQKLSLSSIVKTKEAAKFLSDNNIIGRSLILVLDKDEFYSSIKRAFRNIKDTTVVIKGQENIEDVLRAKKIVILDSSEVKNKESKK